MTCGQSGVAMGNLWILLAAGGVMAAVIGCLTLLNNRYTLSNIKSKTVGDGQHGTAQWATDAEIRKTYALVPFQAASWRKGLHRPEVQGLVLGSISHKRGITALVDKDDVHCLMIGASGVGKTAYFLYPNLEYACASGMSFLALDTKGDLARNYGAIAEKYYGYHVSVVDLRNPTRSDGYNLMTLINHYMDAAQATGSLAARAKAEKYAKILAKTIVSPNGDTDYGQNAYFYDAAEGLLTSVVLLLAEFLPPDGKQERRHIVSVFKLVQELLAPSGVRGKNWFTILMEKLPPEHKARWFAGAALNTSDQAMASVMSTVLSRLNAFLDSELEQVLCFDSSMNAERFASEKSAIFLILPEEDQTKNFMAGLMIQTLARELFAVADENGGRLPGRVVFFCDELGTMPAFDILPLFSAGRSRGLTMVPIIQALAQLEKNYGREGAEILTDNCQDNNHHLSEAADLVLGNIAEGFHDDGGLLCEVMRMQLLVAANGTHGFGSRNIRVVRYVLCNLIQSGCCGGESCCGGNQGHRSGDESTGCGYRCRWLGCGRGRRGYLSCCLDRLLLLWYFLFKRGYRLRKDDAAGHSGNQPGLPERAGCHQGFRCIRCA